MQLFLQALRGPCVTSFRKHKDKCFTFFNVSQTFNQLLAPSTPFHEEVRAVTPFRAMVLVGASVSIRERSPRGLCSGF